MRNLLFLFSFFIALPTMAEEIPQAEYKISDADMQIFVRYMNNIEQCIFPELTNHPNPNEVYAKWDLIEEKTMEHYQYEILRDLVGKENAWRIFHEPHSIVYFTQQHEKWNNQKSSVNPERCEEFKPHYQQIREIIANITRKHK